MKNTHGGVLLLLKVTLIHGCFSRFLNCINGTKSRNASHMNSHFYKEKTPAEKTTEIVTY